MDLLIRRRVSIAAVDVAAPVPVPVPVPVPLTREASLEARLLVFPALRKKLSGRHWSVVAAENWTRARLERGAWSLLRLALVLRPVHADVLLREQRWE